MLARPYTHKEVIKPHDKWLLQIVEEQMTILQCYHYFQINEFRKYLIIEYKACTFGYIQDAV